MPAAALGGPLPAFWRLGAFVFRGLRTPYSGKVSAPLPEIGASASSSSASELTTCIASDASARNRDASQNETPVARAKCARTTSRHACFIHSTSPVSPTDRAAALNTGDACFASASTVCDSVRRPLLRSFPSLPFAAKNNTSSFSSNSPPHCSAKSAANRGRLTDEPRVSVFGPARDLAIAVEDASLGRSSLGRSESMSRPRPSSPARASRTSTRMDARSRRETSRRSTERPQFASARNTVSPRISLGRRAPRSRSAASRSASYARRHPT
mmetsp:Transcript_9189/g.38923  ORF Transcript_9189/g.38923 Transcript_9189/m.38923 type:complete len:270 (+) Transcript_9189:1470-2279(+)